MNITFVHMRLIRSKHKNIETYKNDNNQFYVHNILQTCTCCAKQGSQYIERCAKTDRQTEQNRQNSCSI